MYNCEVCHKEITNDAHGGIHPSAGDHDPAYHVAKAYHIPTNTPLNMCISCSQIWPCETEVEYGNNGRLV